MDKITIIDTSVPEYIPAHAKRNESRPNRNKVKTETINNQSNEGFFDLSCDRI